MSWFEALILGLIQGLTEFLPVSSSGHLELGEVILHTKTTENLTFTVVVHGATVLSTIFVFYKDILQILTGTFRFKWNAETKYFSKILISMIPVAFVGIFLKDQVENLFTGNLVLVGSMLLVTAMLLSFTYFAKNKNKEVSFIASFIIGISQAIAVIPGISRSGATISTALMLGINKERAARFSFLMVLIPIILANVKSLMDATPGSDAGISIVPLLVGFLAAFISGLIACKLMIGIVKRGKLIYFAVYCFIVGITAIVFGLV